MGVVELVVVGAGVCSGRRRVGREQAGGEGSGVGVPTNSPLPNNGNTTMSQPTTNNNSSSPILQFPNTNKIEGYKHTKCLKEVVLEESFKINGKNSKRCVKMHGNA